MIDSHIVNVTFANVDDKDSREIIVQMSSGNTIHIYKCYGSWM